MAKERQVNFSPGFAITCCLTLDESRCLGLSFSIHSEGLDSPVSNNQHKTV